MKGEMAEYVIPFGKLFAVPRTHRSRKAITAMKRFVFKHTRKKDIVLTRDVNAFLWKNSKNIPRRMDVVLKSEGERVFVYLKGSKQIEEDKKKKEEMEKKKKEKAEKKEEKEEKTPEEKAAEAEEKRRAEEKKEREKITEKLDIKRGTGR